MHFFLYLECKQRTRTMEAQQQKQIYTYSYDDMGVRCRYSEDAGYEPVEPSCLNCGYKTDECDCGDYEEAWYVDEDEEDEEDEE